MMVGPFPARMCATASDIARCTANGSIPSTRQLGMLNPGPRADSRGSAVASPTGVDTAYWLFSMKKHKGSFQAAARLNVSRTEPMFTAPSPKYVTVTASVPARRWLNAKPAACGTPPPTIALVPIAPAARHCRCIDPPRPRQ
jgi:hypothetical protein